MLEGLLVETERWDEAFELLKDSPEAIERVLDAYTAWLLAQGRSHEAYRALRYAVRQGPGLCKLLRHR